MTATLHLSGHRLGASDKTPAIPNVDHPPWMKAWTPCKDDPGMWFAEQKGSRDTREAKWRCLNECPVLNKCLSHALTTPELKTGEIFGVWGGLTGRKLSAARRKLNL